MRRWRHWRGLGRTSTQKSKWATLLCDTPLLLAFNGGHADTATCLITKLNADAGATNLAGATCLHSFAGSSAGGAGDAAWQMIEVVLEHAGDDLLRRRDAALGWTPIHYALYSRNEDLARTMVERLCSGAGGDVEEQLAEAQRNVREHQLRQPSSEIALFRGRPWDAQVSAADGVVAFHLFSAVRSKHRCPKGGKGYYELEILSLDECLTECLQFGFASAAFERVPGATGDGVGDDRASWAVDGVRKLKWHKGRTQTQAFECTWQAGDVVGLACDLVNMRILVSLNGSFDPPNGFVFELVSNDGVQDGLFAAFSCGSGRVQCNLGQAGPFRHAPPGDDFKAFAHLNDAGTEGWSVPGR